MANLLFCWCNNQCIVCGLPSGNVSNSTFLILFALGGTFFLSTSGIFIRDISNLSSMVMRLLFFLSGVIITPDMLPAKFGGLLMLNPILHFVETGRDLIIYAKVPPFQSVVYMFSWSLLIFTLGYSFFRKRKGTLVDYR